MIKFVHVGFGNYVSVANINGIYAFNTKPLKEKVENAKINNMVEDVARGKKTRTVLTLVDGTMVLSAINSKTLVARIQGGNGDDDVDDDE